MILGVNSDFFPKQINELIDLCNREVFFFWVGTEIYILFSQASTSKG
jgi:hypothetical protein